MICVKRQSVKERESVMPSAPQSIQKYLAKDLAYITTMTTMGVSFALKSYLDYMDEAQHSRNLKTRSFLVIIMGNGEKCG